MRCASGILHGVVEGDVIEVSCKSNLCGKRKGVLVLHRFNTQTGELISTSIFKQPERGESNGTS